MKQIKTSAWTDENLLPGIEVIVELYVILQFSKP